MSFEEMMIRECHVDQQQLQNVIIVSVPNRNVPTFGPLATIDPLALSVPAVLAECDGSLWEEPFPSVSILIVPAKAIVWAPKTNATKKAKR